MVKAENTSATPTKEKPAKKPLTVTKAVVDAPGSVRSTKANGRSPSARAVDSVAARAADRRGHYVEVAAYFIAERRGFAPGDPLADWLAAENEVDRLIAEGKLGA